MTSMNARIALAVAVTALVGTQAAWAQGAKEHIASPAKNAVVTGSSVHVVLEATGIEIAPAAAHKPGTAHHHLFLDTDLTAPDAPVPAGVKGIVHLGKGQTEFTFDSVPPGPHRLIAELGDPDHVPIKPLATDTVKFTVKP